MVPGASTLAVRTASALEAELQRLRTFAISEQGWDSVPPMWKSVGAEIVRAYVEFARAEGSMGASALITAGPPGAGKSWAVLAGDLPFSVPVDAITVDADDIKALLLGLTEERLELQDRVHAFVSNQWTDVLGRTRLLPDGQPLLRAELGSLVHGASLALHGIVRRRFIEDAYNVIIQGTLSWARVVGESGRDAEPGQGLTLLRELSGAYEHVEIVAIDVPPDVAEQRAFDRWWHGREAGSPGARYTPADAVRACYPTTNARSVCVDNAIDTFRSPFGREVFGSVNLSIVRPGGCERWRVQHGAVLDREPT